MTNDLVYSTIVHHYNYIIILKSFFHFLSNLMVVVYFGVVCHDGSQHPRLCSIELFPRHIPGVARVDLFPEGGSLCHDFLYDVLTVHLHRGVVLLAGHLRFPHCGEALVLLSR